MAGKRAMRENNLIEGHAYFMCSWLTIEIPVPEIETWIYTGLSDEDSEDGTKYLVFQDPESFYIDEILKELTDEQKNSYTKPKGPKLLRVKENELEGYVYNVEEVKQWVNEIGTEPNSHKLFP